VILKTDLVVGLLLIGTGGVLALRNVAEHPATAGSPSMATTHPRAPIDLGEPIDFVDAEVLLESHSHGQLTTRQNPMRDDTDVVKSKPQQLADVGISPDKRP